MRGFTHSMIMVALGLGAQCALAQPQGRLDTVVIEQASCKAQAPLSPEIAAFRLMEMSKVMNRERFGSLIIYAAAVDPTAGFAKVNGLVPSRFMVLTKRGLSVALIGASYGAEGSALSDKDLLGSYAGALQKQIDLVEISNSPALRQAGVIMGGLSSQPVRGGDEHMLYMKLASGERLVVCGPKSILNQLLF